MIEIDKDWGPKTNIDYQKVSFQELMKSLTSGSGVKDRLIIF